MHGGALSCITDIGLLDLMDDTPLPTYTSTKKISNIHDHRNILCVKPSELWIFSM